MIDAWGRWIWRSPSAAGRPPGAEHFPIHVELASIPFRKDEMPRPEPDAADLAQADAMIQDARTQR
jgi:hypothetical protein